MTRLIIHINDPKQEKVVEELLEGVKGIAVERDPAKPKKKVRAKANVKRKHTPAEKRFMAELTQAMQEVKDHVSRKKKLGLARDLLNEL
ncbi:MAG: hypothetical protein IPH53_03995 [Flavobacteriales bacterium]|nr:hypothetical protein [Flavobacteriales bacterium]MBK7083853.1 hypothetical protein [Flavobacteriales bacterium]MBK7754547.1 hypothetical protein [Flavobacteriales bacterium]MBK9076870.1 hypothetical protein [Flavobacteriales bacterium]MBK9538268.1 hypothetical protein [Flavobacteriales bacterium]